MPEIREKQDSIKVKEKAPKHRRKHRAARNAGRQLTAKYRKELAQRQQDGDGTSGYAVDQTELLAEVSAEQTAGSVRRGADGVKSFAKNQRRTIKERNQQSQRTVEDPAQRATAPPNPQEQMRQAFIKERREQAAQPQTDLSATITGGASPPSTTAFPPVQAPVYSKPNTRAAPDLSIHPSIQTLPAHQGGERSAIRERISHAPNIKQRPRASAAAIKTRQSTAPLAAKPPAVSRAVAPAQPMLPAKAQEMAQKSFIKRAQQSAQRLAQQNMVQQTQKTAKAAMELSQKITAAVTRAAAAMVSAIAGLVGGAVLIAIFCVILVVGAVMLSPLGILFSDERSAPGSIPVNAAIAQINVEYAAKLEELQAGDYEDIEIDGQPPDWREVIAVFACKTAGAADGVDVASLDADRVERLRAVFWDMTEITAKADAEKVLHITITAKTAEDMRIAYAFTNYQSDALDVLLEELGTFGGLLGDLSIRQEDAAALLANLPADLSPERRAVIQNALTLVGKVNYFWGGKSLTLGWDSRWGTTMKVTAAGSSSTGTYRPYGMDCSGFVDWVFYNATGGSYIIGHGGGAHSQHGYCTDISWREAIPGDLVFYPDDSHVGIVGGRDANGSLLIIHCASGYNNVVITGLEGFTSIGRPVYYTK